VTKVSLPYLQVFPDRHGRRRVYFRRAGFPRVALPSDTSSPEFLEAYQSALTAGPKGLPTPSSHSARTIHNLISRYYSSPHFEPLAAGTKRSYRSHLEPFRQSYGHLSVAGLRTSHLEQIFLGMGGKLGKATNLRKRLHKLFDVAQQLGWVDRNPVTATKLPKSKSGGFAAWSDADIDRFKERWPEGSRERLALLLLLLTGQRRSDVVGMGWQHVSDGRISVSQQKTSARLKIAIHPDLCEAIDAGCPRTQLTFLLTERGKPFSEAGFTAWFVERARMAGLNDRSPHGLRKSAGRRLAEAGCSTKQIAAVLGHRTLSEAERYTRDADQAHLADSAIARLKG